MLGNTDYGPERIQAAVRMMIENKVRAAAVMTFVMDTAHISELGETRDKPIFEMMVGIKVAPTAAVELLCLVRQTDQRLPRKEGELRNLMRYVAHTLCVLFLCCSACWCQTAQVELLEGALREVPSSRSVAKANYTLLSMWPEEGKDFNRGAAQAFVSQDSKSSRRAPAETWSKPNNLTPVVEERPFPGIFPRSKAPATKLWVCDLRKESSDRRLMLLTLQGIVNRSQPEIYCLYESTVTTWRRYGSTDQQWLDWMLEKRWIQSAVAVNNDELLNRYRNRVKGMVITDPDLPASINVATMLASVNEGIVVSPQLAKGLSLPVLDDLRGRWTTSAEAYRWAFDKLWPRLNHHVIACAWPRHLALRDYLVENKVFTFWISGPHDPPHRYASPVAEKRLMEQLLAKMPVNIPVLSFPFGDEKEVGIGEGPGVSLFSEFGKYLVGSIDCANLSVHSGISVPQLRQKPAPPPPRLDDGKVYLSWVISDGDNLEILMNENFPQIWKDSTRGKLPLGWTLSPAASVLIPDIVEYYYAEGTPDDEFLGAVSGVGYTYSDLYGDRYRQPYHQQVFDGFLQQTATYMNKCDERDLWVMKATRPEVINRYAEKIPLLDALFLDYGKQVSTYTEATYSTTLNVPVFRAATSFSDEHTDSTRDKRIKQFVDDIHAMTRSRRPVFLHAFVYGWTTDLPMLKEVMDRLGPDYVAVRPDQLATLYREHQKKSKRE